jgi:hypothetical protein
VSADDTQPNDPLTPEEAKKLVEEEERRLAARPWYQKLGDWAEQFAATYPYLGWAMVLVGFVVVFIGAVYALVGKDDSK